VTLASRPATGQVGLGAGEAAELGAMMEVHGASTNGAAEGLTDSGRDHGGVGEALGRGSVRTMASGRAVRR
jgi:hypothetical protein